MGAQRTGASWVRAQAYSLLFMNTVYLSIKQANISIQINRFKKFLKIKQIQQDSSSANKNKAMSETTQKLQKPKCFSPPPSGSSKWK